MSKPVIVQPEGHLLGEQNMELAAARKAGPVRRGGPVGDRGGGTPHYGSAAIGGYLKHHLWGFQLLALLGRYLPRATFRSQWGVLSLLPAPAGIYPGTRGGDSSQDVGAGGYPHPCANSDLYQAQAWKLGLTEDEAAHLQRVLDGAASFHRRLYAWHVGLDQTQRDRLAVIAGVRYQTLFRFAYKPALGFLWEVMDRVTRVQNGNPHRDGDGRVPLASAMLENVESLAQRLGVSRSVDDADQLLAFYDFPAEHWVPFKVNRAAGRAGPGGRDIREGSSGRAARTGRC